MVEFGLVGKTMHQVDECVEVEQIVQLKRIYRRILDGLFRLTAVAHDPRLILMVKEPRPGRVKTRLGRDIGMVPAAWWFRHQTRRLIRRLDRSALVADAWRSARTAKGCKAVSGPRICRASRRDAAIWAPGWGGFCAGPAAARVIVGGDIPGVTPRTYRARVPGAWARMTRSLARRPMAVIGWSG